MAVCTFFGHRECPSSIKFQLRETLIDLLEHHDVTMFYVGNQGGFDAMVRFLLRELAQEYRSISYAVVLAYMPKKITDYDVQNFADTMLPEGIETVPRRFAISWRNKWMLRQADFVVTYVTHCWGGAFEFSKQAERLKKTIIRLGE